MDYIKFKGELYEMTAERCIALGRNIRILEKNGAGADGMTVRFAGLRREGFCENDPALSDDTLCIIGSGQEQFQILHWNIRTLYDRYEREGWQGVLPEIFFKLYGVGESEKMILRPFNYFCHPNETENGIYWRFGDIALVLYMFLFEDKEGCVTMKCSRAMAAERNLSDEILLTNALLCSSAILPPKLCCYENGQRGMREYRLTTDSGAAGAVALFYPGVKEWLAERFDGDYYVGFLGTREVVIHPASDRRLGELKSFVSSSNVTQDRKERLTDRVYRYSCRHGRLIEV